MTKLLKNYIFLACICIVLVSAFFYFDNKTLDTNQSVLWEGYEMTTMEIEGNTLRLVVADNPARWSQGLMHVRKPVSSFDGMIFRFPTKAPQTFWNQNTFVPLTLFWIADGKIIGKSELPSIEESKTIVTVNSPAPADTVIEVIR